MDDIVRKSLFSRAPLQCQVPSKVSPIHSLQEWLKRKALGSVIPRPGFLWRRGELMQPRDHLFGHPCRWLFKTTSLLLDVLSPILVKLCSRVVYMFAEFLLQRRRHAPSPARALWRRRQRRSTLEQGRPDGRTVWDRRFRVNGASKLFPIIEERTDEVRNELFDASSQRGVKRETCYASSYYDQWKMGSG